MPENREPIHVKIGPVDLYEPEDGPITKRGVNPTRIRWSKHHLIETKKIVRYKPHTQCTQPIGLWACEMQFSVLNNTTHRKLLGLDAGPYMVQTASMELPCWIEDMSFEQVDGTDDETFEWTIVLLEQYPTATSAIVGGPMEDAPEPDSEED